MIRLTDITLPFDHNEQALTDRILNRLEISSDQLINLTIVRKALDARNKNKITAVYTIDADVKNEPKLLTKISNDQKIAPAPDTEYRLPLLSARPSSNPLVVGSGPCGLFAALILAQAGLKPIVIERGKHVTERLKDVHNFWQKGLLNPESNVQFGHGGAGTFSDGKLTTQVKDKNNRLKKVLTEFVLAGAPQEILYLAKPHIGTDKLVKVVKNICHQITSLGGQIHYQTKLTSIKIKNNKVAAAIVNDSQTIETDCLILAMGHSAADTFQMLNSLNIPMLPKPFSIGVRIEHPQTLVNTSQYGKFATHKLLPPAEYKLVHHCTNGMSTFSRNSANANSAILVNVTPKDFPNPSPLAGIEFQKKWEQKAFELGSSNYFAPAQLVGDFLARRPSKSLGQVTPSYKPGITLCDLDQTLPDFVAKTIRQAIPKLDKKLKGFAMNDAVMTAIESRSSSPLKIIRDETFQSPALKGLYPAGEGPGHAGGIISAAIDGIKTAEAVCQNS